MQVKNIAECSKGSKEHFAILLAFIKLPLVIKIFVLSIFEWLFYTGFTVFVLDDFFPFLTNIVLKQLSNNIILFCEEAEYTCY